MPEPDDLRYSCTCPDAAEPCKHGVAAMLAFAAEIGERPDLLRLWRVGPTERARIGAAKGAVDSPEPPEPLAPRPAPVARWQTPPWQAYLGTDAAALEAADAAVGVRALMPPLPATAHESVGGFDVTGFVDSARAAIRRIVEREPRSPRQGVPMNEIHISPSGRQETSAEWLPIWDGADYAANTGHHRANDAWFLQRFPVRAGDRLLDLGCGAGDLTALVAGLVPDGHVLGVDRS